MATLLFIGIAVLDQIFTVDALPSAPIKYRARDLSVTGGGLAANAAFAVARLGGKSIFCSRLGKDVAAHAIVAGMEAEGVDCTLVRRFADRSSPISAIFVDAAGERMIVNHADPAIPDDVSWLPGELPAGTSAVLGDIRWEKGAHHMFALARKAGVPAVLDVDRAPVDAGLLDAASHVALSTQALGEMTGITDPREGIALLHARHPGWLAVTAGGSGTHYGRPGDLHHSPAFEVEVVDTLAAGDVWHGALALALAEGRSEHEAVRFASAVAALKCTRPGGRDGTPTRSEVEAFLTLHGKG
jgi:sulfofructose kinase